MGPLAGREHWSTRRARHLLAEQEDRMRAILDRVRERGPAKAGALVGRLDAEAHRAAGRFEVKALHLADKVRPGAALLADLAREIGDCTRWHGTTEVRVRRTVPAAVRAHLAALLR